MESSAISRFRFQQNLIDNEIFFEYGINTHIIHGHHGQVDTSHFPKRGRLSLNGPFFTVGRIIEYEYDVNSGELIAVAF